MVLGLESGRLITFPRPLTRTVTQDLEFRNDSSSPVAFKVKTTAPRVYCVKPNLGRIEPHSSLTVQILKQPFTEEPPANEVCRDKFMILSMPISPDAGSTPDAMQQLWAHAEEHQRDRISQVKLRAAYGPVTNGAPMQRHGVAETEQRQQGRDIELEKQAQEARNTIRALQEKLSYYEQEITNMRQRRTFETHKLPPQEQAPPPRPSPTTAPSTPPATMVATTTEPLVPAGYPGYVIILVALVGFLLGLLTLHMKKNEVLF